MPLYDHKEKIIFIDTKKHLIDISVNENNSPVTVTAETGVTMEALCDYLEKRGYGFNSLPAPEEITLGGVLAINRHGSSLPSIGEKRLQRQVFG